MEEIIADNATYDIDKGKIFTLKEAMVEVEKDILHNHSGEASYYENNDNYITWMSGSKKYITFFNKKQLEWYEPEKKFIISKSTYRFLYTVWNEFRFDTIMYNQRVYCGVFKDIDVYTNNEELIKYIRNECKKEPIVPNPPEPTPGGGGETDKTCSNTGQFGGGGTPLKDIKLFLYANNVTKGTIKLSKPQVEVGTFATDWRPNPSDYVERNSPAYKEIKGLAIQHNKEQNKKYIEVQATDGTVYGVDLWGGDAQKLLEQQQAEIEELKKLVQTLETKINV